MTLRALGLLVPKSCDHDGFDGVHTIFGLVEDDRGVRFEHIVGDLKFGDAKLFEQLLTNAGISVVHGSRRCMKRTRRFPVAFPTAAFTW